MENEKKALIPKHSGCGSAATGSGTPPPDVARNVGKPLRIVLVLPGVEIPSLNRLKRAHWASYARLRKGYSRILQGFALRLFAAVALSSSTTIISWEVASLSGTRSRHSSAGTTPNDTGSSGSTGRKKGRRRGSKFKS